MATGAFVSIGSYSGTGTQGLAVTDKIDEEGDVMSVFWNRTDTDQQILHGSNILEIPTSSSNRQGSWGGSQTFSVNSETDCIGDINLALSVDFNVPNFSISEDLVPRTITTLLQKPSDPNHKFLNNTEPVGYSLRGIKEGDKEPMSNIIGYQQGFKKDESVSYDSTGIPAAYTQNGYPNRGEGDDQHWMELPTQKQILKGSRTYYDTNPLTGDEPISLSSTGSLSKTDSVHMSSVNANENQSHDNSGNILEGFNNWINTSLIRAANDNHINPKTTNGPPPGRFSGVLSEEDSNEIKHTGNEFLSLNNENEFEIYSSEGVVASDLFKTYLDNNHVNNLLNYYNDNTTSSYPLKTLGETSGLQDGDNITISAATFSVNDPQVENTYEELGGTWTSADPSATYGHVNSDLYTTSPGLEPMHTDFNGECVVVSEDGNTMAVGQGYTISRGEGDGLMLVRVADNSDLAPWNTYENSGMSNWHTIHKVEGSVGDVFKDHSQQTSNADLIRRIGKVRVYKRVGGVWKLSGTLNPPESTLTPPSRVGVTSPIVMGPRAGFANGNTLFEPTRYSHLGGAIWSGVHNHSSCITETPYPGPATNGEDRNGTTTSNYTGFTEGGLHGFTNNKYISINSDGTRIVVAESNKNSGAPYNGWSGTFDYTTTGEWKFINEGYVGRYSRVDMDYKGIPGAWDISLSGDGNSLASLDLRALAGNTINDRTGCAPVELTNYNKWKLGGIRDLDHFNPGDYDENDWAQSVATLNPSLNPRNIENPKNWQWAWFISEYGPRNRWDYNYDVGRDPNSVVSHSLSQSWARASLERILDSKTVPYSDFIRMRPRISHRILRTGEDTPAVQWVAPALDNFALQNTENHFSPDAAAIALAPDGPREFKAARSGYMQAISFKENGISPSNPYEPSTLLREDFDTSRNAINIANISNEPDDVFEMQSGAVYENYTTPTFPTSHFEYFKEAEFPGGASSPYVPHPCNVWIRNWDPTNHGPNQDNIGGIGYNNLDRINGWINHKVDYIGDIGLFGRGDKDIWHQYIYRKWMNFNEALNQHYITDGRNTGYPDVFPESADVDFATIYSAQGIIPNGTTPHGFPLPTNYHGAGGVNAPEDILGNLINLYSGYDPNEGYYGQTNGQWPSKSNVHDMPVNGNYVRNSTVWDPSDINHGVLQNLDWKIPEIINLYIRNTYIAGEPERWAAKSVKMSLNGNRIAYITDAPTPVDRRSLPLETYSTSSGALGGTITNNPSWPAPANCEVRIIEKNSNGKWVYMNHSSGDMYSGLTIPTGHEAIDITMSSDGSTVAIYSKRPNLYPKWAWEEVRRIENGKSWETDISVSNSDTINSLLTTYAPGLPSNSTGKFNSYTSSATPTLFGKSVAVSGPCPIPASYYVSYSDPQPTHTLTTAAVIGGPLYGANGMLGIALVYNWDNEDNIWKTSNAGYINAGSGGANDMNGSSVAINKSGDIIAIGAPGNNSNRGRIRVFKRGDGGNGPGQGTPSYSWTDITNYHSAQSTLPSQYQNQVDIVGESVNSMTGSSVAIAGDPFIGTIVVSGEPNLDKVRIFNEGGISSRGADSTSYGLTYNNSGYSFWHNYGTLTGPANSGFGSAVAIASNSHSTPNWHLCMAVSAPLNNSNTGFVTIYMPPLRKLSSAPGYNDTTPPVAWDEATGDFSNSITISGTQVGEKFGSSLALGTNGDIVVVGSPYYNGSYTGSGRITVWRVGRQETSPIHQQTLLHSIDGLAGSEHIGRSVAIASLTSMEVNLRYVHDVSTLNAVISCGGDGINEAGVVRFYKQGSDSSITKIGTDVVGDTANAFLGAGNQLSESTTITGYTPHHGNISMSEDGYNTLIGACAEGGGGFGGFGGYVQSMVGGDSSVNGTWSSPNISPFSSVSSTSVYLSNVEPGSAVSGNKYYLNGGDLNSGIGIESPDITLIHGNIYCLVWPDAHPLRFSITPDGTHNGGIEYVAATDINISTSILGGIYVGTSSTTIFPAAATGFGHTIIRAAKSMPAVLYYYCSSHPGMGGRALIQRAVPWIEPIQEDGQAIYDSYINDGLNDMTRGVGEPAITLHNIVNGVWTQIGQTIYPEGYYDTGFRHRTPQQDPYYARMAGQSGLAAPIFPQSPTGFIEDHWRYPRMKYSLGLNSAGTRLIVGSPMTIPEDSGNKTINLSVITAAVATTQSTTRDAYSINGRIQPNFELVKLNTYIFTSSNVVNILRFSITPDGSHNSGIEYTTGVNIETGGTSGNITTIQIDENTPTLYYYSDLVKNMGGRILIVDRKAKYTSNYYRNHNGEKQYIIPRGEVLIYDWNSQSNTLILKNKLSKNDSHASSNYSTEIIDETSSATPYSATESNGDIKYPSNFSGASTIKTGVKYTGPGIDTGCRYGSSVSISGTGGTICVGAPDTGVKGQTFDYADSSAMQRTRTITEFVSGVSDITDTFTFIDTPTPTPGPKKKSGTVFAQPYDIFKLINDAQKRSNYDITDFTNLPPIGEPINWKKQFKEVPDGAILPPQLSEYDNPQWASSDLKSKVNFPLSKIIKRIEFKIGTQIWQTLENNDLMAINATELSESSYRRLGLQTHGFLRSDGTRESTKIDNWIPGKTYQAVIPLPILTKTVGSQLENFTQNTEDGYLACLAKDQEIKVKVYYSNFEDVWDVNNVYATKGYTAPIYNKANKQRGNGLYITNAPQLWIPNANLTTKLYGKHFIMTKEERDHFKNIKGVIPKKMKTSQSINKVFPAELYPTTKILIDLDSFNLYSSHLIITSSFPSFSDKTKIPILKHAELFLNSDSFCGRMDASLLKGITNKSLGLYSNEFNIDNLNISAGGEYYVFPLASRAFGGSSLPLDRFDNIRLELMYTAPGLTEFGMDISKQANINVTCRGEMLVTYKGGVSTIKLY